MTQREKGDLYWKKRTYYLEAADAGGGLKEGYLNRDMAEEVLSAYDEMKKDNVVFAPGGKEFRPCSPSAAGRQSYADSVARLMCVRDRLIGIVEGKISDVDMNPVVREIFADATEKTLSLMRKVIDDFFLACGLYENGQPVEDKEAKKNARISFEKSSVLFESKIEKAVANYGSTIMNNLRKEAGIEARIKNRESEELLERGEIQLSEASEFTAAKEALEKYLFDKYFIADADPMRRRIATGAFFRYRHSIDRLIYEKVKEYIDLKSLTYEQNIEMRNLKGFTVPQEIPYEGGDPDSLDDIIELGNLILNQKRSLPGLIDAQNLSSIALYSGELGLMYGRARALNRAIDRFTLTEESSGIERDTWLVLFEHWVMAETICRVSVPIMEFLQDNENTTVGEAETELQKIRNEISYIFSEPESRMALRKMVLERSGYGAL
jgi:hypothetical protein